MSLRCLLISLSISLTFLSNSAIIFSSSPIWLFTWTGRKRRGGRGEGGQRREVGQQRSLLLYSHPHTGRGYHLKLSSKGHMFLLPRSQFWCARSKWFQSFDLWACLPSQGIVWPSTMLVATPDPHHYTAHMVYRAQWQLYQPCRAMSSSNWAVTCWSWEKVIKKKLGSTPNTCYCSTHS